MSSNPRLTPGLPTIDAPCSLCRSDDAVPVRQAADPSAGVPGVYTVVRCLNCGFLYQRPRVRDDHLAACYPDTYLPHQERAVRDPFKANDTRIPAVRWALFSSFGYSAYQQPVPGLLTRLRARRLVRRLRWDYPRWVGRGRYLDVGCGSGGALGAARALGWKVAGIEIDEAAAKKAQRFSDEVYVGDIFAAPFAPGGFDLVTAFHVLEHVPDPIATLRRMLEWLAPRGVLVLEVPNAGGVGAALFGRSWVPLDLPRHLSHFTRESLALAVEQAGGRIIWCWSRVKPRDYARNLRRWLADRGWDRLARFTELRVVFGILKLFLEVTLPVVCWLNRGEVLRVGVIPGKDSIH